MKSRKEYYKAYYAAHPDRRAMEREREREKLRNDPSIEQDRNRRRAIRSPYRHHNLTIERYEEILTSQSGCCGVCVRSPEELGKRLQIDHDHGCCPGKGSCGACVRGLLCARCNTEIHYIEKGADRKRRSGRKSYDAESDESLRVVMVRYLAK